MAVHLPVLPGASRLCTYLCFQVLFSAGVADEEGEGEGDGGELEGAGRGSGASKKGRRQNAISCGGMAGAVTRVMVRGGGRAG